MTDRKTTLSAAITHSAVNGNLRKLGATSSPVQCLHQCKVPMKRKLRRCRACKRKPWVGGIYAPTETDLKTTTSGLITPNAVNGTLRKFGATSSPVQCLHECKVLMKWKLRRWRAVKRKPWVGAKSTPTGTDLQTTPSAAITHSAVNENLRKFGATSSPVQCLHQCKVPMKRKLRRWIA